MTRERRKWSEADKLQILQEAEQNGLTETLRKYTLSQSLFHRWRRAYNGQAQKGLSRTTKPWIRKSNACNRKMSA